MTTLVSFTLLAAQAAPSTAPATASPSPRDHVHLQAPASFAAADLALLDACAEEGFARAARWLGRDPESTTTVDVTLFESHEALGLALHRSTLLAFTDGGDGRKSVAFALGSGGAQEGAMWLGPAPRQRAEAAGAAAALATWTTTTEVEQQALALAEWLASDDATASEPTAADLARVGLLPTLDRLLDAAAPQARPLSPELARIAWQSLFAAFPANEGAATFDALTAALRNTLHGEPAALAPELAARLDAAWTARLAAVTSSAPPRPAPAVPAGIRGFCFSHEGYRWVDGYGSRAAARSLARLGQLGANAVCFMPFAFQRDPGKPALGSLFDRREGGFASETDAAIAVSAEDARHVGLLRVMKPHVWCGHGRWCGEIAMTNDADWTQWFAEFERCAVHYALLARRTGCEVLCVGTELVGTTGRVDAWRALLAKLRAIYPGLLTYCSNWGDEVERIPFWDTCDVVGVSDYWPLADAPGADEAALRARCRDVLARVRNIAKRNGRPLWFLEAGFPDVAEPWITPNDNRGRFDGGADQARAYRILLDESRAAATPDGLLFWKWPSDLDHLGRGADQRYDFWPCGRAAETVLREEWSARRP